MGALSIKQNLNLNNKNAENSFSLLEVGQAKQQSNEYSDIWER